MANPKVKGPGVYGSIKKIRKDMENSRARGGNIFPLREGGTLVRFLEEPDGWAGYEEHYSKSLGGFLPCIEDDCPGCEADLRATKKVLANAYIHDEGKVFAVKLPQTIVDKLLVKFEKRGTILDRDFDLIRRGTGPYDTEYDVDAEDQSRFNFRKYQTLDLTEILSGMVVSSSDDEEDDDDEDDEPRVTRADGRAGKYRRMRGVPPAYDDDDDDEEEEEEAPRRTRKPVRKTTTVARKKTRKR